MSVDDSADEVDLAVVGDRPGAPASTVLGDLGALLPRVAIRVVDVDGLERLSLGYAPVIAVIT